MPRRPRLFFPGAIYHVYCRVARGEFVFDDPHEGEGFVAAVQHVRDLHEWRVLAWCLMGNHYHIVVKTGAVPLWRSMLPLQARVARGFNRRRGYLGRLWQSRYRARVIDTQEYFQQVVAYVHLNPVAAGIVDDPADYLHSGHRAVLGIASPRLVDIGAVLDGFGGRPWREARNSYAAWLRAIAEGRWYAEGVEKLPWWVQARDGDEIACPERHPEARTFDGLELEEHRPRLDLDELCRRYEQVSGLTLAALASRRRNADVIRGRVEFTILAVARYRLRSCDVATALAKDPSSVSRWLTTGMRLQPEDPVIRQRINALDHAISQLGSTRTPLPASR